jgi:hypothetical protein
MIPKAIRYPARMSLIITLRTGKGEKIYPPYLKIYYKSKLTSSFPKNYLVNVSFNTDYTMDIKKFQNAMLAILITLSVIVLIAAIIKFNVWRNTHPKLYDADTYIIKCVYVFCVSVCGLFGKTMFWFLWAITFYWYIFFKMQYRIYLLLPPMNDESYKTYYEHFYVSFLFSL